MQALPSSKFACNLTIGSSGACPSEALKMCDNNNTQSIADYLAQLLKDKKQLAAFPNVFLHLERLLDDGKQSFYFYLPYFWCFDSFEIEHRGSLYLHVKE